MFEKRFKTTYRYQHLLGHVVDTKTIHSIVSAGQMSHKHFYRFVNIVSMSSPFLHYTIYSS